MTDAEDSLKQQMLHYNPLLFIIVMDMLSKEMERGYFGKYSMWMTALIAE